MSKKALIVWGGWDGHTPKQSADVFAPFLQSQGYDVELSNSLEVYADAAKMAAVDLVVPIWTMGTISGEQEKGLLKAIENGAGIAGFHGGIIDSFRQNTGYQWMTGGQWVAHPGNCIPAYQVNITNRNHPITQGISDFTMLNTEQYWMHVDPSNQVLATTTFKDYNCVMPYAWTRTWGKGKVFVAAWGHTFKDFEIPEAKEIVQRGMLWASR